jgi:tRNA(Met) C34 N-acetyltransferase TmcA
MIGKKIDDKIQILLKNCMSRYERAIFLIIGDKSRDQISNLHNFYSKINPGKKLNILWCYDKSIEEFLKIKEWGAKNNLKDLDEEPKSTIVEYK